MKKQPKQDRSKQVVTAILDGATRVLSRIRLRDATTNKIAEVAGVGIGSLYDYFPNKNSIAAALVDKRIESVIQQFRGLLASNPSGSIADKIDEVVLFLRSEYFDRREFLREIFLIAPEMNRMEAVFRARAAAQALLAEYLTERSFGAQLANQKAFLLIHGVLGIAETYIVVDTADFSAEQLASELRMLMRFHLVD